MSDNYVIPLQAVPAQALNVVLYNQPCSINLYQKSTGLFIDLYVDSNLIIGGVLCLNQVYIVRDTYLGFIGDIGFVDTIGSLDPYYTGLGGRFLLVYTNWNGGPNPAGAGNSGRVPLP